MPSSCDASNIATINFNIPSSQAAYSGAVMYYLIQPGISTSGQPLPAIHCPVKILGPNSDGGLIELDGEHVTFSPSPGISSPSGIVLIGRDPTTGLPSAQNASGSTVMNLVINRFPLIAIYLYGVNNTTIANNMIGLDVTGELAGYANGTAKAWDEIHLEGASKNLITNNICGQTPGTCIGINYLNLHQSSNIGWSGCESSACEFRNIGGGNNIVQGNQMGLNKEGTRIIGGYGNPFWGAGTYSIGGSFGYGIFDQSSGNNLFGGLAKGQGNVVAGSAWKGIFVSSPGDQVLGNTVLNIFLNPIDLEDSGLPGISANNVIVDHNFIGMMKGGNCADATFGGSDFGYGIISTGNTSGMQITNNVIVKNVFSGIALTTTFNPNTSNVVIANNIVGTDATKTQTSCGNGGAGIFVTGSVSNSLIANNTIGYNGSVANGPGILIRTLFTTSPQGISVLNNQTYANAGLGIDIDPVPFAALFGSGSVLNDPTTQHGDGFTGNDTIGHSSNVPNHAQNFPLLSQAKLLSFLPFVSVNGSFHSVPNSYFLLQFFSNDTASSQNAVIVQGMPAQSFLLAQEKNYLGSWIVHTDSNGNSNFNALVLGLPNLLPMCSIDGGSPGKSCIDATATLLNVANNSVTLLDTSEQSPAVILN